jgi:hypothetical protein
MALLGQPGEKYFDYFVFNIIDYIRFDCGLHARGLDIISPLCVEAHAQDL